MAVPTCYSYAMSEEREYLRMSFGDALRLRRERAGLNQRDVARALHTHQSTVARWEKQTIPPRDSAVVEGLARLLGASVAEMRGGLVPAVVPYASELAGLPTQFVQEFNKYAPDLVPEDQDFVLRLVKRLAVENKAKRARPGSADADDNQPPDDNERPNTAQLRMVSEESPDWNTRVQDAIEDAEDTPDRASG
jgi:transcriptional regulator with XRE-family HTH domain